MENIIAAAKLLQQYPQSTRRKTIEALYSEFAAFGSESIREIEALESRLIDFLQKANIDLALAQLDDCIQRADQRKTELTEHNEVSLFSAVRLLDGHPDTSVEAFRNVIQTGKYPNFIPFASYYPHTIENPALKCQKLQDRDIRELTSDWDGTHPYAEQIHSLKEAATWLDELQVTEGVTTNGLNALDQFVLIENSSEDEKADLERKLISESSLTLVDTDLKMSEMCQSLSKQRVIAVDVEFSHLHSYLGSACVMQITGLDGSDYVVDLLRVSDFDCLKDIMADESILKIFHGSSVNDIYWLERDLRVFVVNLYDTAEVAIQQNKRAKLQILLREYGIQLNKDQQTSDWAIRPLTEEQVNYAREDSHWLIGLAWYQRKWQAVNWSALQSRFLDIEMFNAATRIDKLNKSILSQIHTAPNEDALKNALFSVYTDVWCRFYDVPLAKFRIVEEECNQVENIIKEEMIIHANEGQFNGAVARAERPKHFNRVITACPIANLLEYLGLESTKPSVHRICVSDLMTEPEPAVSIDDLPLLVRE